jgi:hypothetical protein
MHSISASGMKLFEQPISSTIGGLEIDLVSAPLAPGEHRLVIESTIGGIEIYLPRYVQFTVEGGATIGGFDVHDGPGTWNTLVQKLRHLVHLPESVPTHAVENPDPTQSISIHFVIDGGIGGIDIYRL